MMCKNTYLDKCLRLRSRVRDYWRCHQAFVKTWSNERIFSAAREATKRTRSSYPNPWSFSSGLSQPFRPQRSRCCVELPSWLRRCPLIVRMTVNQTIFHAVVYCAASIPLITEMAPADTLTQLSKPLISGAINVITRK